jgi:MinD superfamily P-loop ATPase
MFGESHVEETAADYGLKVLGKLPLDPKVAAAYDEGEVRIFADYWDKAIGDAVEALNR